MAISPRVARICAAVIRRVALATNPATRTQATRERAAVALDLASEVAERLDDEALWEVVGTSWDALDKARELEGM